MSKNKNTQKAILYRSGMENITVEVLKLGFGVLPENARSNPIIEPIAIIKLNNGGITSVNIDRLAFI